MSGVVKFSTKSKRSLRSSLKKGFIADTRPVEAFESGEWNVNFIRVIKPKNSSRRPLVILAGLLESFSSFQKEVEILAEKWPVYFVELPGLGSNDQIPKNLDDEKLVGILKHFLDGNGLDNVNIVSFSTSSSLAYLLANTFPEKIEQMILIGAGLDYRQSVKAKIKSCLDALTKNDYELFATLLTTTLMNWNKKEKFKRSLPVQNNFYTKVEALKDMDESERNKQTEIWKAHLRRMLHSKTLGSGPRRPLIILVGEFDHFTTVYDGFELVQKCLNGHLVIAKSSDHALCLQKSGPLVQLIERFFSEGEISAVEEIRGLKVWDRQDFPVNARRLSKRYNIGKMVTLTINDGKELQAKLLQVSGEGVLLEIPQFKGDVKELEMSLPISSGESISLIIFQSQQKAEGLILTCLFRPETLKVANKLNEISEKIKASA